MSTELLPSAFSLPRYLARVGLLQAPAPDAAGLRQLMRSQLFHVPFENLSVQAGERISLEPEAIARKILEQGRGGYCYEVNGLFAMALSALGFRWRLIGARPMFYGRRWAKTHVMLLVECADAQYLCDTGFGRFGLRAPLELRVSETGERQDWERFRLQQCAGEWVLQAWVDGAWENQVSFDEQPMEWVDFMPAHFFNSQSPESVFVQKLVIVQHREQTRCVLSGEVYTESSVAGVRVERYEHLTPPERAKVLFGLDWPEI
jgi:N-hydroxyarylamine O-acetyltransferase